MFKIHCVSKDLGHVEIDGKMIKGLTVERLKIEREYWSTRKLHIFTKSIIIYELRYNNKFVDSLRNVPMAKGKCLRLLDYTYMGTLTYLLKCDITPYKHILKAVYKHRAIASEKFTDFKKRRKLRNETSKVAFSCKFDELGRCQHKTYVSKDDKRVGMNCCGSCHVSFGYFNNEDCDPQAVAFLAKNYDKTTGFWRKGQGCIIPRKWRSDICVGFNCGFKSEVDRKLHATCMKSCSKEV